MALDVAKPQIAGWRLERDFGCLAMLLFLVHTPTFSKAGFFCLMALLVLWVVPLVVTNGVSLNFRSFPV